MASGERQQPGSGGLSILKRAAGLAHTDVTNELADAVNSLHPPLHHGEGNSTPFCCDEFRVKVVEPIAGQRGRYSGKSFVTGIKGNVTGDLVEADLGDLAAAVDVKVWNIDEINGGGIALAVDKIYVGQWIGVDDDGFYVVAVTGFSIPMPEFQYQVLQGVSDNQVGYGFVRAHELPGGDEFS